MNQEYKSRNISAKIVPEQNVVRFFKRLKKLKDYKVR